MDRYWSRRCIPPAAAGHPVSEPATIMLGNRVHPEYSNPRAWRGRLPDVDDPAATQLWPEQKRLWQPPLEAAPLHSVRVPWPDQPLTRFTWTLIRLSGVCAALAIIAVALRVIWAVWPR